MIMGGQHIIENPRWDAEYRFWPLGDIHWWANGCDEALFRENRDRILHDRRAYWWGLGDFWDLISWQDGRFDPEQVKGEKRHAYFQDMAKELLKHAIGELGPIRKKCLGLLRGNHEWKWWLNNDRRLMADLAENLRVPFLGYSAFKDVVFRDAYREVCLRWYLHHGAGWAQTKGGKLNRLLRFIFTREADVCVMGHVHIALDDVTVTLAADKQCRRLLAKNRLGIVGGTFLRAYQEDEEGGASYAERRGYDPTPLGCPVIVFRPGPRTISVEKPMGKVGIERILDEQDGPDNAESR